jgi:DivIVA domain-containing protein
MDPNDPEKRIAELERRLADQKRIAELQRQRAEPAQRPVVTPEDVQRVAFSKPPIGLRGYNEDEVDAFLDRVEIELTCRSTEPGFPPPPQAEFPVEKPDCWWCGQRPADEVSGFPMYRVLAAKSLLGEDISITATTVTLRPLSVPIPICGQCVRAHVEATRTSQRANTVGLVGGVALVIAGIVLAFVMKTAWSFIIGIAAFSVWMAGLSAIRGYAARRRLAQSGTARYEAGADYPAVIEQKKLGWKPQGPWPQLRVLLELAIRPHWPVAV